MPAHDHSTLVYNLRSLARFEHADLSIGDEAADMIERQAAEIARLTGWRMRAGPDHNAILRGGGCIRR
jgi:hypothetical protein